ncbi:hypothetical protein LTR16_006439 [Cryomyces antarcticus]|uniref:Uncharacterized protein n=1 Tax=Cryomyces antarcticus TaxID=329879 RepID=A0ABR0LVT9_9PEZI|nr:hypothetical protein LTR16_006439 [Cryomyces antarcticus]
MPDMSSSTRGAVARGDCQRAKRIRSVSVSSTRHDRFAVTLFADLTQGLAMDDARTGIDDEEKTLKGQTG